MSNDELLPCPFCGGEPKLMLAGNFYRIGCWDCLAVGVDKHEKSDAIAAWNRRATPAQPQPVAPMPQDKFDAMDEAFGRILGEDTHG